VAAFSKAVEAVSIFKARRIFSPQIAGCSKITRSISALLTILALFWRLYPLVDSARHDQLLSFPKFGLVETTTTL
jgi:hypothetical protein